MNREFNDELLSAYLDGQLASAELAAVEAHLAANPDARQLLSELRMLSDEVRALPRQSAGPQFADRVVQAALAQAKVAARPAATVSPASTDPNKVRRGSRLPVVLAGVAAIAAAVALAVWIGGGTGTSPVPGGNNITKVPGSGDPTIPTPPAVPTAAEAALAQLRQASPQEGEVVVVRIRMAPGMPAAQAIDAALTAAGIASVAGDQPTVAGNAGAAYRQQLAAQFGGGSPKALMAGTSAAVDAVFVESSWASLEKAVGALAAAPEQALELQPLAKVAAKLPVVNPDEANGEGEVGPKPVKPPQGDFAQRLPASIFRLAKTVAEPVTSPPAAATIDGQRKVRVLLLVEQVR